MEALALSSSPPLPENPLPLSSWTPFHPSKGILSSTTSSSSLPGSSVHPPPLRAVTWSLL
ncbi:hypothetical protein AHAS_Ahas05G0281500 [Arachis hypogaea]